MPRSLQSGARALLVALLVVSVAPGQSRVNLPWWNSPVKEDLGLTADQQSKIRQIVRSYRSRLLDARNNTRKAEEDLDDIFNDANVDPKQAQQVIKRVSAARAESSGVFLEMSVQLRSILTLEQWRTLIRRWDEVKDKQRPNDTQTPP